MDLEPIVCGSCGAALTIPDGVRFVNCRHCGTPLRVQRTESVTFTEVLKSIQDQSSRIAENTEVLRIQGEIALLDREWEERTTELMVRDRHGRRSIPGKTSSVIIGVVLTLFGTVWAIVAWAMFPPLAYFSVVVIGIWVWASMSSYGKAEQYEHLKEEHERRRSDLLNRITSQGG